MPLATHTQGQLMIDACLGTQLFVDALVGAWYFPFAIPLTITGNHHVLAVNFDIDMIFGNKILKPAKHQTQGIYSNNMPTVQKFNDMVTQDCEDANLYKTIYKLYCKYQFNEEDHQQLESVNKILTNILTQANKRCQHHHMYPWSPELHHAYFTHCYWAIWLTEKQAHQNMSKALNQIHDQILEPSENNLNISASLRWACKQLHKIHWTACLKWQEYQTSLAKAAEQTNDKQWQKLILHLKCAEQNWKCFSLIKAHMKPWSTGGINKILIPNPDPTNAN